MEANASTLLLLGRSMEQCLLICVVLNCFLVLYHQEFLLWHCSAEEKIICTLVVLRHFWKLEMSNIFSNLKLGIIFFLLIPEKGWSFNSYATGQPLRKCIGSKYL